MDELLRLVFPAVVRIRDGTITPADALKQQFNSSISSLRELPGEGPNEQGETELERFVNSVRATAYPAKVNVTVRPAGGTEVFKCTACAVLSENKEDVIMGFEVHDSWLTTSAALTRGGVLPGTSGRGERLLKTGGEERQSLTASEPSDEGRRVVFDVESSDSEDRQTKSDRKAAKFVRDLNFDPEHVCTLSPPERTRVSIPRFQGNEYMAQRAVVRTTPVDLHSRNDHAKAEKVILNEARVLLKCRHPHVLLMLGFCLDHPEGPTLIMEQARGPVSEALLSGPLNVLVAVATAQQVASALLYLHDRGYLHRQVDSNSVFFPAGGVVETGDCEVGELRSCSIARRQLQSLEKRRRRLRGLHLRLVCDEVQR
jgi:hypothetical protein